MRGGAKPETTTLAGVGRREGAADARAAMEPEPAAKEEPPEPRGGRHSGRRREPAVRERAAATATAALPPSDAGVPLTEDSPSCLGRLKGTTCDLAPEFFAAVGVEAREEGLAAVAEPAKAAAGVIAGGKGSKGGDACRGVSRARAELVK